MKYDVLRGLRPPIGRPLKRQSLIQLIELAKSMELGDAAVLTNSEAQVFRYILAGMGYLCLTDGYRCDVRGKTLAFKLDADPATERKNYEHCSIHEHSETRPTGESHP